MEIDSAIAQRFPDTKNTTLYNKPDQGSSLDVRNIMCALARCTTWPIGSIKDYFFTLKKDLIEK